MNKLQTFHRTPFVFCLSIALFGAMTYPFKKEAKAESADSIEPTVDTTLFCFKKKGQTGYKIFSYTTANKDDMDVEFRIKASNKVTTFKHTISSKDSFVLKELYDTSKNAPKTFEVAMVYGTVTEKLKSLTCPNSSDKPPGMVDTFNHVSASFDNNLDKIHPFVEVAGKAFYKESTVEFGEGLPSALYSAVDPGSSKGPGAPSETPALACYLLSASSKSVSNYACSVPWDNPSNLSFDMILLARPGYKHQLRWKDNDLTKAYSSEKLDFQSTEEFRLGQKYQSTQVKDLTCQQSSSKYECTYTYKSSPQEGTLHLCSYKQKKLECSSWQEGNTQGGKVIFTVVKDHSLFLTGEYYNGDGSYGGKWNLWSQ